MTGRTHDLAAITALGLVVLLEPVRQMTLATALIAILACQLGGIAPDIDEPTAPLWRNLPIGGVFGRITGKMLGGHRFLTHSLLGIGIFGGLAYELLKFLHPIMARVDSGLVWWAFIIGVVSHLVMDTFTKEGVPWLLPLPVKFGVPPWRRWRVTTGEFVESLIIFPGLAAIDVTWIGLHYNQVLTLAHRLIG
jgi:inner membrane protein